jgi:hypothetical protein
MGQVNELKDFTRGQLDAVLMKIGQDAGMSTADGIRAYLAGKLVISKPPRTWREENSVIRFSVTSDGTTGPEWITRLEKGGFRLSRWSKDVLNSSDFCPTNGMTTEIAILKGELFSDDERITKNIRKQAYAEVFTPGQKLSDPNPEAACLIREKFSDQELEEMGLWTIIVMHEPIKDSDGDPSLLRANRGDDGGWLDAYYDEPGLRWGRGSGFAFSASQV